jgi:HEAT repeat protein/MFS-type transporter involved in bile tolerance (Atg22 family)
MTTATTEVDKIRRLPWLIVGDALNITFVSLTFSGPVFILFLDQLGLDSAQIGLLLSLIPFCGLVALFIAPWVTRFGYKRVFITFWAIRKFVISLLLLTPIVLARFGSHATFIWVAAVIFGFALCRAIAETGVYPWQQGVVPDSIRGKFSAISSMITTLAAILATTGASLVIDAGTGLGRFMILMGSGIVVGFMGVAAYARVPAEARGERTSPETGHLKGMRQALHDSNFRFFLVVLGLATLGSVSVISFVPLFMKTQIGLTDGMVVLLGIGTYLGGLLTSYLWGWLADRYGSKPIMQFNLCLMLLLPVAWFSMPRGIPTSGWVAMLIALVSGAAAQGWQISWTRYLFVNAMPRQQKSSYMPVYYAWFGFVNGCAPLLAGQILGLTHPLEAEWGIFKIDSYTPLFALSFALLVAAVASISPLQSDRPMTFRHLARMFWQGNPIKALALLIRYRFAGTEVTRITTTERLGETQNPLSANELIESLSDPSFNVRYEAIHAIGRMPPEPELVAALLDLLNDAESELSSVAARSLGKLGDTRAILPLRRALRSGYPFLEANSVRALAMLGDVESVPYFIDRLKHEPSSMLRIAYASALGKLGSTQAVEELFELLRQTESEVMRGEIGLALARLAGDERYYLQHWHALRFNSGTATAQAILSLQKSAKQLKVDGVVYRAEACAQGFAQGDVSQGVVYLQELIDQVHVGDVNQTLACILRECRRGLAEFGGTRFEFILLSLHALEMALRGLSTAQSTQARSKADVRAWLRQEGLDR